MWDEGRDMSQRTPKSPSNCSKQNLRPSMGILFTDLCIQIEKILAFGAFSNVLSWMLYFGFFLPIS